MEERRTMILLEGNISAGKSTLGRRLAESNLFGFVEEPVGAWQKDFEENLLDLFYRDTNRWAFTFQLAAFTTRAKTWTEVLALSDHRNVVLERSLCCDRFVFAKNCYESGLMKKTEWQVYCRLWDWLESNWCTQPNRIVYLRTPAEECYNRIQEEINQGQRKEEKNIPLEYLQALEKLHDKWLLEDTEIPVTELDGTKEWTAEQFMAVLAEAGVSLSTGKVLFS